MNQSKASKKIEKMKMREPRPTEPNLVLSILKLTDKVNEIIERLNESNK